MNACPRSGSARPSSFLAFFHDSLRRCRAARIVSRQQRQPKRSRTYSTSRFRVQRGAGSAPSRGGVAAVRWAAQTASRSAAAIFAQRGGGHRCRGTRAPPPPPVEKSRNTKPDLLRRKGIKWERLPSIQGPHKLQLSNWTRFKTVG